MTSEDVLRRRAAAMLLRLTKTASGRENLAAAGHLSGQPIMVALDSDTIAYVFERLRAEQPDGPAHVGVFWDRKPARLTMLTVDVDDLGHLVETQDAAGTSTVGMLIDTMRASGARAMSVCLTDAPAVTSGSMQTHELATA